MLQSFTHQRCLFHRFAVSRFHHSQLLPIANQDLSVCKKWGLQSKPRLVCLLWGEGERRHHTFRSCPLWAKKSPLIWVPKNKLRLCLFAFGRAEVRVASTMTKSSVNATSLLNAPLSNALYSQQTTYKIFTIEYLQVIHLFA